MIVNQFGEKYYKLGLHLHTTLSDGRKTPNEVAREYKDDGYDAIALTDHWVYGEGGTLEGLHIISGCEYNLGGNNTIEGVSHIVSLFTKSNPNICKSASNQEVVNAINEAGGIAVLAHPNWSLNKPQDLIDLKGITATEIYNAVSDAGQSMRPYSDYYIDICANAGAYPKIFATDDAHAYNGNDNRLGFIMVHASELTDEALVEAIKNGDFYATEGPELYVKREGNKLIIDTSPCEIIGTMSNLSWDRDRVLRGNDLTHFEYEIRHNEKWVRVEARDKYGKKAWSNIFVV
jgi:DNA polymerase III alpha subunit